MSKADKPALPAWVPIVAIIVLLGVVGFFGIRAINGPSAVDVNSLPDSVKYKNPYLGTPGTPGAQAGATTGAAPGGTPSTPVDLRQQRGGPGATPNSGSGR